MPVNDNIALKIDNANELDNLSSLRVTDESEFRYYQLIQGLPTAIYTCDRNGYIKLFNKAAVALWGQKPQIGKDLWCGSWKIYRTDGTPLPLDLCPMAVTLKEARPVRGEEIIVERPDGVRRHVIPHPEPLFDSGGKLTGAVNMLVDITDYKSTEHALLESEERFRTLANQAPIMIWMSDANGRAIYVNSKWCEVIGMPAEKGMGTGWMNFIHPEDKENAKRLWTKAFRFREEYNAKFRYRNARGEYCIIHANCCPRIGADGEFMGYIGILNDITLQEEAKSTLENLVDERTRELLTANIELERSNHELEQFAYIASHDLQEPLRKIKIFSEKLNDDPSEELRQLYLEKINASAGRMSMLVKNVLEFSRLNMESDVFTETDLNYIMTNLENDFEVLINEKNAKLIIEKLPVIEAIPLQMNQLFYNLISNSLKFSIHDTIPVINITSRKLSHTEITQHSKLDPNLPYNQIVIEDNGIGFSQDYAERIFIIFQRLTEKASYEGTGIGLALCRKIVTNHNGIIYAKGQEGKGCRFYVILPEIQPAPYINKKSAQSDLLT